MILLLFLLKGVRIPIPRYAKSTILYFCEIFTVE